MNIHVDEYDDWIKIYVDGNLRNSGHSFSHRDWLELLAEAGTTVTIAWSDTDDDGNVTHTHPIEHIGPARKGAQ